MPAYTRRFARLACEALEARAVPASFAPANTAELIDAIRTANGNAQADVITLAPGAVYTLTAADADAPANGLPMFTASDPVTIVGNGATIERATAAPQAFRLIAVASGANLNLEGLTLQGGSSGQGGAIFSQGALALRNVVVRDNSAVRGYGGGDALGGGIYSEGSLSIAGGSIRNNLAQGGRGRGADRYGGGGIGGLGAGGGVYVASGAATFTGVEVTENTARGGDGGNGDPNAPVRGGYRSGGDGGAALGGGLYVRGGSLVMATCTVTRNVATGGQGGSGRPGGDPGAGVGGGLYIGTLAAAELDASTEANVRRNRASTSDRNIFGTYTIRP